jgi:hypothetical protein
MSRDITTVDDVFEALGGVSAVARSLNVNYSTASEMKRRKSIPSHHWIELALTASVKDWRDVTLEVLARVHTAEVARKRSAKAEASA